MESKVVFGVLGDCLKSVRLTEEEAVKDADFFGNATHGLCRYRLVEYYDYEAQQARIKELGEGYARTAAGNIRLQDKVKELEARLDAAIHGCPQQAEIDALKDRTRALEAIRDVLIGNVNEERAKLKELEAERNMLDAAAVNFADRLAAMEAEHADTLLLVKALEAERDALLAGQTEGSESYERLNLQMDNDALRAENARLRGEVEEKRGQIEGLLLDNREG